MWVCWGQSCANEIMSSVPRRADSLVHGPPVDPLRVNGHQRPSGEESTQILHSLWEKNNSKQMPWVDLEHGSGPRGDKMVPQRLQRLPADWQCLGRPLCWESLCRCGERGLHPARTGECLQETAGGGNGYSRGRWRGCFRRIWLNFCVC